MADLSTTYLGLRLKNPLVASPSPLTEDLDNVRKLEDAGVSAIVFHSLFEEQINLESQSLDAHLFQGTESFAESLTYFPDLGTYRVGPETYLDHLRQAKAAVDVPIIGSLNGISEGGWIEYAKHIEDAGADALELNIYFLPTDPNVTAADVETMYLDLVRAVAGSVNIPVAVKLGPYFSSLAHFASELDDAGSRGLVIFNRFYQPNLDIENLEVVPDLDLSSPHELRLRLRWAAILFGRIQADLAITGGVHAAEDVVKAMMSGAKAAMMTSAILQRGIGHFAHVLEQLGVWLEEHEYESIEQMQGSMSQRSVAEPAAFERANYLRVLTSYIPRV